MATKKTNKGKVMATKKTALKSTKKKTAKPTKTKAPPSHEDLARMLDVPVLEQDQYKPPVNKAAQKEREDCEKDGRRYGCFARAGLEKEKDKDTGDSVVATAESIRLLVDKYNEASKKRAAKGVSSRMEDDITTTNLIAQANRIKKLIDTGVLSRGELDSLLEYGVSKEAVALYKQQYAPPRSLEAELDEDDTLTTKVKGHSGIKPQPSEPIGGGGYFSRSGSLLESKVNQHPTADEIKKANEMFDPSSENYFLNHVQELLDQTPKEVKGASKILEQFEEKYIEAVRQELKAKINLAIMKTHLKKIYAELKNEQA